MNIKKWVHPCWIIILSFMFASFVKAQVSQTPKGFAEKLRSIGTEITDETIRANAALYVPLHMKAPREGVKIAKDEKYGPDERNRLDVYTPVARPKEPAPILVFVHGGGFTTGDKSIPGSPFYGNIGYYFARKGLITIIPTYRLAPKHKWPAATEDMASVLDWVQKNGIRFGGDTKRVFLMGHSAGAAHAASYVFQEEYQLKNGDGLAGAILVSGLYNPALYGPADNMIRSYYGDDTSKYSSMASINFIEGRKIPLFLVFAEFDPAVLMAETSTLFQAICSRDKSCPAIKQAIGHNHLSEIFHINTGDESIGPDIVEFVRTRPAVNK